MGAFCSTATAGVIPVAQENKVPLISGVSSAPFLTEKRQEFYFRIPPTEAMLAEAAAPLLSSQLGIKRVAFLAVNDDWGRGTVKAQSDFLRKGGLEVVGAEYFNHGETNFTPYYTRIQSLNPDAVFFVAETQDAALAMRQFAQMGLPYKKLGVGAMAGAQFLKLAGDAAESTIAIVPYAYTLDTERNRKFVAAYESRYGAKPDKYAAAGYDTLYVVAAAVRKANSADPVKIRDALEQVDVEVVQGRVKFNEVHQAFTLAMVVRIENGVPKVILTRETAPSR